LVGYTIILAASALVGAKDRGASSDGYRVWAGGVVVGR
jgi:hypothetical protein